MEDVLSAVVGHRCPKRQAAPNEPRALYYPRSKRKNSIAFTELKAGVFDKYLFSFTFFSSALEAGCTG